VNTDLQITILKIATSERMVFTLDLTNVYGFDITTVDTLLWKQKGIITYVNLIEGCR
jgi:hypothetical protein